MPAARTRPSNVVLLFAVLAWPAALAPFVASWHWTLDLLACFVVQAMGWLWLAAGLLAAGKRWWPAAACAAFAVLATGAVLPGWWREPPARAAGASPLRVLTVNLLRGNEAHAAAAIAAVRAENPDVLFLSELTPEWWRAFAAALPELPHRCVQTDDGWYGSALLSRWPLQGERVMPLGVDWAPAVRAVVASPTGSFGVLGVHVPRPGNRRFNENRDRALAAIAAALDGLPATRVVLGDCNATPWSPSLRAMLAATGLVAATDGSWRPTWPSTLPCFLRIPIDHVLVSADVGVAGTRLGASFGSDHLPLAADLQLPAR